MAGHTFLGVDIGDPDSERTIVAIVEDGPACLLYTWNSEMKRWEPFDGAAQDEAEAYFDAVNGILIVG